MTLLSFSGTTSQGPFWQQILAGRKTQTCRLPRKIPIKPGDRLHLYWMVRIPASQKPVHKIGEGTCLSVERLQYEDFAWDDEFARRDGFRDSRELQRFFGSVLVFGYQVYDVISWDSLDAQDVGKPTGAESVPSVWSVRSMKTGVVCHTSATAEAAARWANRFLGEHGEVVQQ